MDRILVAVFDNETKAYEGKKALQQLDSEGSISLYGYAVVVKHADGTASVKSSDDVGPFGTLTGTALGSLIGLLGGPVGFAAGTVTGFAMGGAVDLYHLGVGDDFIADVSKSLTPNKVAVVAEVNEEWTTPVDTRMENIGGIVFRRALSDVEKAADDEEVAAMKADVAQFKAEIKQSKADRKVKLQGNIDLLEKKIQVKQQKAKDWREAKSKQAGIKADVLKKNAKAAGKALRDLGNTPL